MSFSIVVLIPLLVVLLLNLPFYKVSGKAAIIISLLLCVMQGLFLSLPDIFTCNFIQDFIVSLSLDFAMDGISKLMLFINALVLFCVFLILSVTENNDRKQFRYVNLLLLAFAGMNGLFLVKDLFSVYVFIETVSTISAVLIAIKKDENSLEASFKYLLMSSLATVLMLVSVALIFLVAGGTDFLLIADIMRQYGGNSLISVAVILFIIGLFIKGGIMPCHGWLPASYFASSPSVSIYLAGIATKALGIYTLIRLCYSVFGFNTTIQNILLIFASVSIVFGAFGAISQKNFKTMLGYSSISQMGYIILGLGAGTPFGIAAAVFHFFNHSVLKTLLFVNSTALEKEIGDDDMDKMGGLASKMPVTSTTSIIGFLSTAGVPPLSGFWSKLMIILALWTSGKQGFALIAILAAILTMTYFVIMQKKVFFGKLKEGLEKIKEPSKIIIFISVLLSFITISVGVLFPCFFNVFKKIISF